MGNKLDPDGAERTSRALDGPDLKALVDVLVDQPRDVAGVRLFGLDGLQPFLNPDGPIGAIAARALEGGPRPVRAILFDKTPAANWSLPWHQDRVVAVRERMDVKDYGPWSRKHGALHVAPPFDVLRKMITLRIHIDPVPETNAPLLISPGSHRLGRFPEIDIPAAVARLGVVTCLAEAGDVWAYGTPILHASERATKPSRRRVLQVDYASGELPSGLTWLGV
jgi:hypothetical protein